MANRNLTHKPTLFWALAKWGVSQGFITEGAARLLARAGTRKSVYWNRHILDLCGAIADGEPPTSHNSEGGICGDE